MAATAGIINVEVSHAIIPRIVPDELTPIYRAVVGATLPTIVVEASLTGIAELVLDWQKDVPITKVKSNRIRPQVFIDKYLVMTNNGVFTFKAFNITNTTWTPIIVPVQCCYFSFNNLVDDLYLKADSNVSDQLLLPQGNSEVITATYFHADFRFQAGDILFFAQGVRQATSVCNLTTVRR